MSLLILKWCSNKFLVPLLRPFQDPFLQKELCTLHCTLYFDPIKQPCGVVYRRGTMAACPWLYVLLRTTRVYGEMHTVHSSLDTAPCSS